MFYPKNYRTLEEERTKWGKGAGEEEENSPFHQNQLRLRKEDDFCVEF